MLICDVMAAYFKGEVGDVGGGRVGMSGHQVVQFATFFNTWIDSPFETFSVLYLIFCGGKKETFKLIKNILSMQQGPLKIKLREFQ